ncbi:MAG: LuxR C-terminal-related transcriptional regulator [Pseudonocardia sp.]
MVPEGDAVPVAVVGSHDLCLTAIVDALGSRGYRVALVPLPRASAEGLPAAGDGPGVLIVDIDRPHAARAIPGAVAAGWTVLAVGGATSREAAAAAVVAGAEEWIGKDATFAALVETVHAAAAGGLRMGDARRGEWHEVYREAVDVVRARARRLARLSRREGDVLHQLADGLRAADIATASFVSIATVRTHIRSILTKLEVNSQDQAVAEYRKSAERWWPVVDPRDCPGH